MKTESAMAPDNSTLEGDFYFETCLKEYIEEYIHQGNNITSLTEDQLYECCNTTLPNNCTLTKGKLNLIQEMCTIITT